MLQTRASYLSWPRVVDIYQGEEKVTGPAVLSVFQRTVYLAYNGLVLCTGTWRFEALGSCNPMRNTETPNNVFDIDILLILRSFILAK